MRNKLSRVIWILPLLILWVFSGSTVHACSPTPEASNLTLADRVNNAPMILVGTVIHTYEINYSNNYSFVHEVDVRVEQYLKGEGPAIVRISGFGQGADCLSVIQNDVHAVFFVNGNPDGILNANYTGVHDATWQPTPETISEIVSITNHTVDPYPLPLSAQIARWFSHPLTGMRLAVVVLVLVFVAGIFYMRYHDPRKPKQKAKRS